MQQHPTIVFAGGGTGGHLFPGIAVADELRGDEPRTEIIFTGSDRAIERDIVSARGHEHWTMPVEPSTAFKRRPHRAVWNMWRSYSRARQLLRERRPNCVVGLGGFASVPVALAARRSGVPLVLLEQNIVPGRATALLSRFAACICLSFPETVGPVSKRHNALVTGNPVRREFADMFNVESSRPTDSHCTLLVLGGSQGASAINDAMIAAAGSHRAVLAGWRIVHQTGQKDAARVREAYKNLGLDAVVEAFFDDLAIWYRDAALVVSRAGATTLAELACCGCPGLLVPYPHSLGNHQLANARWFAESGAAEVIDQAANPEMTAERFVEKISRLSIDSARRGQMQSAMRSLARPAAARDVADCIRRQIR